MLYDMFMLYNIKGALASHTFFLDRQTIRPVLYSIPIAARNCLRPHNPKVAGSNPAPATR